MIIFNLFLYSGIFNIVLGFVYYVSKTTITPEGIMLSGAMNFLLALLFITFLELKDRFIKRGKKK